MRLITTVSVLITSLLLGACGAMPQTQSVACQHKVSNVAVGYEKTVVTSTSPANGATNIKSGITTISILFSRELSGGGWSIVTPKDYPTIVEQQVESPKISGNKFNWLVKLEPNTKYSITINDVEKFFLDINGVDVEPYTLEFSTGE